MKSESSSERLSPENFLSLIIQFFQRGETDGIDDLRYR